MCERRDLRLQLLEHLVPKSDLAGMAQVQVQVQVQPAVAILIDADKAASKAHDVVQIIRASGGRDQHHV